mgnify:CR=1 FL=1
MNNNNQSENNCDEDEIRINTISEYRECKGCEECNPNNIGTISCCENKEDCIKNLENMIITMEKYQNTRYLQILKELNNLYESYDELLLSYNELNYKLNNKSCDSESDSSCCSHIHDKNSTITTRTETNTNTNSSYCGCNCDNYGCEKKVNK